MVRVKQKKHLKNAILLVGLPGVGLASKLAVDHLAISLKGKQFATLYSPHFPNQVIATTYGSLRPFTLKFYYTKLGKQDVVLVRGDLQPLTIEGQYEVAGATLNFFKSIGGEKVISMAGLITQPKTPVRTVHVTGTSKKAVEAMIKQNKLAKITHAIPIVGMAGLLPTLAPAYGLNGTCMLVETTGEAIDADAASSLVDVVGRMFKKKISTVQLKKRAKVASQRLEAMARQQQQQPQAMPQEGAAPAAMPVPIQKDSLRHIQ